MQGIKVVLTPDASNSEPAEQTVENGKFSFQNQLPGSYSLAVKESGLCWDAPNIVFTIGSESKEDLTMKQTGWVMPIQASHTTTIKYKSKDGKDSGR